MRTTKVVRQAFRADLAFDGERELPGGALVLVEQGLITGVEPGAAPAPDGWPEWHEPGTTLLPGLIDAHTHLCGNSEADALDRLPGLGRAELDEAIEASLSVQLAAGVTAVRDLGDQDWAVVDRHRGSRPARPHVVAAGPPITTPDGHCAAMGGGVRGVAELRRAVRERAEHGADLVKVMATGGLATIGTDVRACQFTGEELRAVVGEAHRLGLPVTAHAHATAGVRQAVAAGVDGIEHCTCLGPGGARTPPGLAEQIAAAGIVVCPTVGHDFGPTGKPPPEVAERMARAGFDLSRRREQVGELFRGGVTMISGVDSGIHPAKPHGFLHRTIAELVECGVPVVAALASATALAARACGIADRTGRLRPGLAADLVIVRGDPIRDVAALGSVRAVVRAGEFVRPAAGRPPGGVRPSADRAVRSVLLPRTTGALVTVVRTVVPAVVVRAVVPAVVVRTVVPAVALRAVVPVPVTVVEPEAVGDLQRPLTAVEATVDAEAGVPLPTVLPDAGLADPVAGSRAAVEPVEPLAALEALLLRRGGLRLGVDGGRARRGGDRGAGGDGQAGGRGHARHDERTRHLVHRITLSVRKGNFWTSWIL
ncbi:amidohydrolase family protein [Actinoplanes flavus]|uniref:Amidohydrolase family protein n=1 Tax=Actinoplanes flavus TaxID=2820290 RepID=A0ABS3UUK6_9ACTN|nr:amidohydrolase family protein [Actinoplanes flavus]MBO3742262.1 amidohydrolase family protein [Actinoplanes flavus]